MKSLFGGLLQFENQSEFEKLIQNIDSEMSLKIIELCLSHCQENGLFNLEESHCLYVCVSKLKEKQNV
jgi:hypothetical protein